MLLLTSASSKARLTLMYHIMGVIKEEYDLLNGVDYLIIDKNPQSVAFMFIDAQMATLVALKFSTEINDLPKVSQGNYE